MNKKVLVLSTGFRRNGNSDRMAQEFAKGAVEAGHEVEQLCLSGQNLEFCRGCFACQKTMKCVIQDDAAVLLGSL